MKKKPITKEAAYKKSEKYGEWFYACPVCLKQFSTAEKLEKHIE